MTKRLVPGLKAAEVEELNSDYERMVVRLGSLIEVVEATSGIVKAVQTGLWELDLGSRESNEKAVAARMELASKALIALRRNAWALMVITHDEKGTVGMKSEVKVKKAEAIGELQKYVANALKAIEKNYDAA